MRFVAYFVLFLSHSAVAGVWPEPFFVDSHLRTFTVQEVEQQFNLGANVVEIDFDSTQLKSQELSESVDLLKYKPNKYIVLHLKSASIQDADEVSDFLDSIAVHSQLLFYANDAALNDLIRRSYPKIYVARSTKEQIMKCLSSGLVDEASFRQNCIEGDLWIYYSFFEDPQSRANVTALIDKIRKFEALNSVSKTRIAIDRIATIPAACDIMKNFSMKIDGVITEVFSLVGPYLLDPTSCP